MNKKYWEQVVAELSDRHPIETSTNGIIIEYPLMKALARFSGLRSKKQRHIRKRVKKLVENALQKLVKGVE